MSNHMPTIERKILAVLQKGLPKSQRPFHDMADEIGIDTSQLLAVLKDWQQLGKLRRIGAVLNHFKVGLGAGAMVVWRVEPKRTEKIGEMLAGFEQVSHAYERHTNENWPYNLYTMVHGKNEQDVKETVHRMSKACGISDYRVLITEKELKKVAPTYIK
jgi:DNA-binding Lrp family transcriptional regulator